MRSFVHRLTDGALAVVALCASLAAHALTPSINLSNLPSTSYADEAISVVANISDSSGTPAGAVDFVLYHADSGAIFGAVCPNVALDAAGDAPCAFAAPPAGDYILNVEYQGDGTYAFTAAPFAFSTIQATPTIALSGLPRYVAPGTPLSLLATVASSSPVGTPSGTVRFAMRGGLIDGTAIVCNAEMGAGQASCNTSAPAAGTYELDVEYLGDRSNAARTVTFAFSTLPTTTPTISLAGLPAFLLPGRTLTVNAAVASSGPTPTGTVVFTMLDTFTRATSIVCTTGLEGGVAPCTFTTGGQDGYQLEVAYQGDASTVPVTRSFPFTVSFTPVVFNTNDSGTGSLRDAINYANSNCGGSGRSIYFDIPGPGVQVIAPATPLPAVQCAYIDGYSQPGSFPNTHPTAWNGRILIQIDGSLMGGDGLTVAGGTTLITNYVRGLAITRFSGTGIRVVTGSGAKRPQIMGNLIGLAPDGSTTAGNGVGIANDVGAAPFWVVGSTNADRNVISGNGVGVRINGVASFVTGSLIGTDASGMAARPNGTGVYVAGGADASIKANTISGNTGPAIDVQGATGTSISANVVGLAVDRTSPLGNGYGIRVFSSSAIQFSGGSGNVIAANGSHGVEVRGSQVSFWADHIGTNDSGSALGNVGSGIWMDASSGGSVFQTTIAYNGGHGVVALGNNIDISESSIFQNQQPSGLGINLLGESFFNAPANDACDTDGGGNGLANYPLLASASSDGASTTITGTLNSTAATTFRLEFFSSPASDIAANRSGRVFLGNASIVTDGSCNASFTATVPAGAAVGDDITATSTDPSGNTSSFSNAASVSFSARVASLSLSTASLTFGPQLIGSTSASQRVTLTNNGTASANISNVSVSAGFVESTTCVAVLAPTSACDIDVSFTPTAMGTAAGQLTINSDTLPDPQTVALSGTGAAAPTFSIATFTSRTVGQVSTVTVFIGNRTGNPVTYSGFNVQFVYPAGFVHDGSRAVQESCGTSVTTLGSPTVTGIAATSGSVSPGVTCTAVGSQMFVPTTPGTYTLTIPAGGFTVKSPFAYSNPVPITATVTVTLAATPAVTIAPASLAFGAQAVSTASPSQAVTLTNSGSAALAIRSIAASSEFTQVNGCPASLAAGASCTIDVKFTPTASGPRTGTLSVATNAGGSPHTVGLTGTGTVLAPSVSLSPASVAFASRTVATASAPQTITLANSGNAPLDISSVAITGDFAFASACPSQLAALASCTIDVTFTPLAVGPRAGTVTIASNAPGSPHAVSLTGTGASGLTPVILVSPSALDFVVEPVGRDSAPQVATVTNTGTATLTFATIVVTGDYRQVALPAATPGQACPVDLAPGASCGIAIVFHPAGINLRTGALSITTNAGSVATTVTLAGTGLTPTVPQLSVAANLSFDHQPVGTTSAGKATSIINTSAVLATITELSASGDFSVSDTCTTIVAGATCSPLVFFQPTQAGPRTGTLTIRTLRDMDPYIVALSGTGDQNLRPVLVVSPTRVGFGNALVGSANRVVVMLTNVGQVPVVVETILGTGNFIATHDCGSIPSRASCAVTITYVPGLPGAQQGAVEIRSNAVDSPHRIDVSGVGCLIPSPGRARLAMPLCGP